ncbi:hypothetical protein Y032_0236g3217 [Ancylostoma ceylanicum]|nr:hypothetical protein Y032_0236g3217 [Ancylostoma ceylanicum]
MYKPYNFEEVSRNKTTYSAYFDQQQEIAREDREKALTDNIVDLAAADLAYSIHMMQSQTLLEVKVWVNGYCFHISQGKCTKITPGI